MGIIPKLHETAMMILFPTNLLVFVIANAVNSTPSTTSESSTKPDSQSLFAISPKEFPNIDPLPVSTFSIEVSDFLSPDIFSQANPFDYFFKKTKKLSNETVRNISREIKISLTRAEFPQQYVPYADFTASLLPCLLQLEDIEDSTRNIQRFLKSNHVSTLPAIFTIDHVISPLFSSYVFSDNNPPVRLLRKLVQIPENEISSLMSRVQKLLNHRNFPRPYSWFAKCLMLFFKSEYFLRRLKISVVEIQRVVPMSIPQDENDSNNFQIDDEVDLQTEDTDSSPKPIHGSIISITSNNDSAENLLPSKYIKKEVRSFLSPEIFSQSNPFAYFFVKAMKLQNNILRQTNIYIIYSLDHDEFPRRYIPYAELASSLISCLISLENINMIISNMKLADRNNYSYNLRTPISKLDPQLSTLFTDDIFSKDNPLPLVLIKLLGIPDSEISNIEIRLQKLLKNVIVSTRYFRYVKCLLQFLHDDYLLLRLKDNIAEMQRTLKSNLSTS